MSKLNARWLQINTTNLSNNSGNLEINFNDTGNAADEVWSSEKVKSYADSVAQGLNTKGSCRASTTTSLPACTYDNGASGVGATLTGDASGAITAQDGVTLVVNDILLLKNQVAHDEYGIY